MQYPSLQTYDMHAGDGQMLEMQASAQGKLQESATRLDVIRFELLTVVAHGVAGHCDRRDKLRLAQQQKRTFASR
jgi:hypothetical protein